MSLQGRLAAGQFAVTTEVIPPKGTDLARILAGLADLRGLVHAVDVADHPRAVARMSSLALAHLVAESGHEPILVVTCRDRNVLELQGTILGAHALGLRNLLCVRGDPPGGGDHPTTRGVYEVDTVGLIRMAGGLAGGHDVAGHALRGAPDVYVGAIVDPGAERLSDEIAAMERKVAAGAQFVQTQAIYDLDTLARFRRATRHLRVPVLAGVFLLESAGMARRLNGTMRGSHVPDELLRRLEENPRPLETMADVAVELVQGSAGLAEGVHVMSLNRLDVVRSVIGRAGLFATDR